MSTSSLLQLFIVLSHSQTSCDKIIWKTDPSEKENILNLKTAASVSFSIFIKINWASTRENLSSGFANDTGADQPAHPRSLISAFVIHVLKSTIPKLATSEISFF